MLYIPLERFCSKKKIFLGGFELHKLHYTTLLHINVSNLILIKHFTFLQLQQNLANFENLSDLLKCYLNVMRYLLVHWQNMNYKLPIRALIRFTLYTLRG